jgi:hypothetical protein
MKVGSPRVLSVLPGALVALQVVVLFGSVAPRPASAAPERAAFAPAKVVGERQMVLQGTGIFRYLSMIDVVEGGLYLWPEASPKPALADVPKLLELRYLRGFDASDFAKATLDGVNRNVSPDVYARVADRLRSFNTFYQDVQKGDRYTLTYVPGEGTTLALNGRPLGTIEGADFAAALFTIWLGDKDPMDESFRLDLLGETA